MFGYRGAIRPTAQHKDLRYFRQDFAHVRRGSGRTPKRSISIGFAAWLYNLNDVPKAEASTRILRRAASLLLHFWCNVYRIECYLA